MTPPAVLFSARPDWSLPWVERLEWLTDILTKEDDSEQRIGLRQLPRRTLSFTAGAKGREAGLLDNLIWAQQPDPIGLPVWRDAIPLAAPATIGATSITVDTTDGGIAFREYAVGTFVALWSDPFTWEIQTVTGGSGANNLTLTALTKNWAAGATVVPVTVATLRPQIGANRWAFDRAAVEFDCDALLDTSMVPAVNPGAGSGVTPWPPVINPAYASSPFLDTLGELRDFGQAQMTTVRRSMIREDSATGIFAYLAPGVAPTLTRGATLKLLSQATIAGLGRIAITKGILLETCGRLYPFWTPSYQNDLVLVNPIASADTTLKVQACGYTAYAFPNSPGRRYLCVLHPTLACNGLTVTGAVDNGDGTETLTLSGAVGTSFPLDGYTTLSYLLLVRLDSDTITFTYHAAHVADVAFPLTELPLEAAAFAGGFPALGPV